MIKKMAIDFDVYSNHQHKRKGVIVKMPDHLMEAAATIGIVFMLQYHYRGHGTFGELKIKNETVEYEEVY